MPSSDSSAFLSELHRQLQKEYEITVHFLVRKHTGIAVSITRHHTVQSIALSAPKRIEGLLTILSLTDCNTSPAPQVKGHNMTRRHDDEHPLSPHELKLHQEGLGVYRFIANTVGHEISPTTSQLASHNMDPCSRHMLALKHQSRFLEGRPNHGVTYSTPQSPPRRWLDSA